MQIKKGFEFHRSPCSYQTIVFVAIFITLTVSRRDFQPNSPFFCYIIRFFTTKYSYKLEAYRINAFSYKTQTLGYALFHRQFSNKVFDVRKAFIVLTKNSSLNAKMGAFKSR